MDSRSFIQQLSSPIPSTSALAALLLAPLHSVSLLSPSLHKYLDSQSHSFNPQDFKPSFIADVQKLIIEKILVDWNDVLSEEDRKVKRKRGKSKQLEGLQDPDEDLSILEILLQLWFYPTSQVDLSLDLNTLQSSDQTFSSSDEAKRDSKAKICVSSLRVCSSLLSRRGFTSSTNGEKESASLHPSSSKYLIEVLVQYQSRVHLGLLLEAAFSEKNKAQRKLTWEDTVKNLVSLPDKVANLTVGKPPDVLERERVSRLISSRLEDIIYAMSTSQPNQMEGLDFISSLLSKLIRTGFVSSIPQVNNSRPIQSSFWESTLSSVSSRLNAASKTKELWPPAYRSTWQALLSRLADSERSTFCKSSIVFLDSCSLSRNGSSTLIASNELGKIGREGSNFLSSGSKQRVELVSELLNLFFSKVSEQVQSNGLPQDDESESGSESESEDLDISVTLMEVLMPNGKELGLVGSPLLARSISFWAFKQSSASAEDGSSLFVESFFEKVVNVWSNSARIRTANLGQEEYLATLFLTLLCHLRDLYSTSSKTSTFLSKISHLPSFLNGVSSHLDHLDPSIRRFGMLIAEIMSSFTSNSVSQEGNKIKKLDFGKTVWDGIGQGKEEARVLRAFVDGWKLHDPSTTTKSWTQEEMKKSLGIESVQETKEDEKAEVIEVISSEEIKSINEKKTRPQPQTRSLPAKVSPPKTSSNSNELPSLFPVNSNSNSRSLIQSLNDSEDERESDSSDSLQAYDDRSSDSSGSSSYEEDSSSESDGEGIAEQMGSALGLDEEGLRKAKEAAGGNKENNQSGLDPGVPKKKRKLPPVYVAELIPLLQANTREENRLGLRNATGLIERKAGWGGEVDENAIQLGSALCGIGNNWRIKDFEKRRTGALAALIVASPRIATGSVIEQYFIHQYSSVQRFAMLDALASASRDLAGLSPLFAEEATLKSSSNLKTASSIAESITKDAMKRAKEDGEGHVPSIAREKSLTMNTRLQPTRAVQELGSSNNNKDSLARRGFTNSVRPKERYIDLAGSVFIFPLIQRFWSHLQEASTKSRRARSSSYGGAGTGTLFSPMMISRFLDALSVMVHSSQNSLDFLAVVSPEILELVLGIARDGISLGLRSISSSNGGEDGEGGDVVSTINSSLAGLALTVLDSSWEIERSKTLRRDKIELVGRIGYWASAAFDREEKKNSGNQINAGSSGRAARISAAVVLRVAEIRGEWKENMLGF